MHAWLYGNLHKLKRRGNGLYTFGNFRAQSYGEEDSRRCSLYNKDKFIGWFHSLDEAKNEAERLCPGERKPQPPALTLVKPHQVPHGIYTIREYFHHGRFIELQRVYFGQRMPFTHIKGTTVYMIGGVGKMHVQRGGVWLGKFDQLFDVFDAVFPALPRLVHSSD